jgi:hypothetical protein
VELTKGNKMKIEDLIKKLNEYPKEYEVTINCPDTNNSRDIWLVEEDNGVSEDGKNYIDIVMKTNNKGE